MAFALEKDPIPLHTDEGGVVRVAGSRITLDQIVAPFREGVTPEEIAMRFDVVDLADVYAVVSYYLHHRESVDEYLAQQVEAAADARARYARTVDMSDLRKNLQARRARG